jgi:hypothetical protein
LDKLNLLNVVKTSNTLPSFAYVSMNNALIGRCPILANGIISTPCTSFPVAGATGLDGLTLNKNKNRMYVVSFNQDNEYKCPITCSGWARRHNV